MQSQMQTQTQTQIRHQPLSKFRLWLKGKAQSASDAKPLRQGPISTTQPPAARNETSPATVSQTFGTDTVVRTEARPSSTAQVTNISVNPDPPIAAPSSQSGKGSLNHKLQNPLRSKKKLNPDEKRAKKGAESLIKSYGSAQNAPIWAVAATNLDIVEFLLRREDTDVNYADDRGIIALHQGVKTKSQPLVSLLLSKGAAINQADNRGDAALHVAARVGSLPLVKLLLEHGADPVQKNREKEQAVHVAGEHGNEAVFNHFRGRLGLLPVKAASGSRPGWDMQSSMVGERSFAASQQHPLWPVRVIRNKFTGERIIVPPSEPRYWY